MEAILLPGPAHLLAGLFLLLVLGAAGAPALSLALEAYGHSARKIFAVRLAQQVDRLGIVLLIAVLLGGGAANAILLPGTPDLQALRRFLSQEVLLVLGIPLGLLIACWAVRTLTWNALKKRRPAHITLGALTVLSLLATIVAIAGAKRHLLTTRAELVGPVPLSELYAWPMDALVWPAAVNFLLLGIGCAAALTPLYLFARRTREDYGRDYYNWSMGVVTKWAVLFLLGQLALLPWYLLGAGAVIGAETFPAAGAGLCALFIAAAALFFLGRSRTPMRYKGAVLLSILLVWVSLTAIVLTASRMLPPLQG